jgi:signal transduction histidine kinase
VEADTWTRTFHLLLNLPFGIAGFVIAVAGLSVSLGTIVTFIGIPLLVGLLSFGRVISEVERWRARTFLDSEISSPFTPAPEDASLLRRVGHVLTDGAGWKALVYAVLMLPVGIATFTATVVVWSVTAAFVTFPLWAWSTSRTPDSYLLWYKGDVSPFEYLVVTVASLAVGVPALLVAPRVVQLMAAGHRGMIRALLGRDEQAVLRQRVSQLSESRDASVDAAEGERRRIERDLHDGAQQRLVALAMDLGLARERLARDGDEGAAQMVGRAHDEAKRAIGDLRDLVRGIHPAVLTERGLDAALSAVAARSPVPVDLRVDLPWRPPPVLEATAYYVVTETLANVGKYSSARWAWVRISLRGPNLLVEVTDDGVGGAVFAPGGGLEGLAGRVKAVEGTLHLSSPLGGPTHVVVELPWSGAVTA